LHWHRVDATEIWHWHAGAPIELDIAAPSGRRERIRLGNDLAGGERPQGIVPAHAWQASGLTVSDYRPTLVVRPCRRRRLDVDYIYISHIHASRLSAPLIQFDGARSRR
jgi:hypothetical protein